MRKIRKLAIVFALMLLTSMLWGCVGLTEEEATDYVQAVLDASYKGEFDDYIEETGATKEEAEKMFNKNIEETLNESGFDEYNLDNELVENYKKLFIDMAKLVNYEISNVSKNDDDNFILEVTVSPLDIYTGVEEEITDKLTDRLRDMKEFPNEDEIVEMSFEIMYEIMADKLEDPAYGDETTVVLRLESNSDGEYVINEDDIVTLDKTLYVTDY